MSRQDQKKHFTIMIVPHTLERTFSLRIPFWLCQAACISTVIFFAAFFILAYHYSNLRAKERENSFLMEEVRVQGRAMEEAAAETELLIEKMEEIEDISEHVADLLGIDIREKGIDTVGSEDDPE